MNPAETADPIEMSFGMWTLVVSHSHVLLDGGPDPPGEWAIWGGVGAILLQSIGNMNRQLVRPRWRLT